MASSALPCSSRVSLFFGAPQPVQQDVVRGTGGAGGPHHRGAAAGASKAREGGAGLYQARTLRVCVWRGGWGWGGGVLALYFAVIIGTPIYIYTTLILEFTNYNNSKTILNHTYSIIIIMPCLCNYACLCSQLLHTLCNRSYNMYIQDKVAAFQKYATMYIRYVLIFRRLDQCYDQIAQPQKRRLIRHVLDGTIGRWVGA